MFGTTESISKVFFSKRLCYSVLKHQLSLISTPRPSKAAKEQKRFNLQFFVTEDSINMKLEMIVIYKILITYKLISLLIKNLKGVEMRKKAF